MVSWLDVLSFKARKYLPGDLEMERRNDRETEIHFACSCQPMEHVFENLDTLELVWPYLGTA